MTTRTLEPTALEAEIANRVIAAGGKCYEVGGAVRDHKLGLEPDDVDVLVTGIPYDKLTNEILAPYRHGLVGESYGVIKVSNGESEIDVAVPRTERATGKGHKDFEVLCDPSLPVEHDLARRDFTVNAMALDLATGELIDPHEGLRDLHLGLIRTVGNPDERFNEDPLRMLRACRFVAKLGFGVSSDTLAAITSLRGELSRVAADRMRIELMKLLSYSNSQHVYSALTLMRDTGVLAQVIPEFEASFGFRQNNDYHHLTVDEHVFAAVRYAVERGFSPRARLAALLHDIAKPVCYTETDGHGHFYEHDTVGEKMSREILARLKFPNEMIDAVGSIVAEHLRPPDSATDKALRRYAAKMGALIDDALACREADEAAHCPAVAANARKNVDGIRERIAALPTHVAGFSVASLALRGDVIATTFGVSGSGIGDLKKRATQAVIDGLVLNEAEALVKWLRESPAGAA